MEEILCKKVYDNYQVMCDEYVAQNRARISLAVVHFLNADTPRPEAMDVSRNLSVHPALHNIDIVQHIFEKVGEEDRKNMVETCKKWAKWFLISGPRSAKEYPALLRRCEHAICVSPYQGDVKVDTFCYCHEAATVEEVEAIHAANKFPPISEITAPGYVLDMELYPHYRDFLIEQMLDASSDDKA